MSERAKVDRSVVRGPAVQGWTPGIGTCWKPARVRSALQWHRQGSLKEPAQLADAMLSDDEYQGALSRAVDIITGAPFQLEPVEGDAQSERLAELLSPSWYRAVPEAHLSSLIASYLSLGVAVATLDWDTSARPWVPVVRALSPQYLSWGPEDIDPTTGLYGAWSYETRDGSQVVTPGDGRWLLLCDGPHMWTRCAVQALAVSWLGKQLSWRDWLRYNERHGLPLLKAMAPAFAEEGDKTAFLEGVSSLGSETTVLLPTHLDENGAAYDLELLEAKDQAFESFQRTIERVDRKFQVYFAGSNAGSELVGTAGSRAASEESGRVSRELAASRARRVGTMLREQLVRPWAAMNAASVDDESLPWPVWQVEPGETAEARAVAIGALGEAIGKWSAAGYEVSNAEALAAEVGLEIEEKEIPPDLAPGAAPVPPDTEQPGEPEEPEEEELAKGTHPQTLLDHYVVSLEAQAQGSINAELQHISDLAKLSATPEALREAIVRDYAGAVPQPELALILEQAMIAATLLGRIQGRKSSRQDV